MAFTLKIETDNAEFDDDQAGEIASILRSLAFDLENSDDGSGTLYSLNGNTIGAWTLDERRGD